MSFILPIACLSIDQNFCELCLFSSNAFLKYDVFIVRTSLLYKLLKSLYLRIFISVGSCNLRDNDFDVFLEEVSKPEVNHGSPFIYLCTIILSVSGKESSNAAKYIDIKTLYAESGHSTFNASLTLVPSSFVLNLEIFSMLNDLYLVLGGLVGFAHYLFRVSMNERVVGKLTHYVSKM